MMSLSDFKSWVKEKYAKEDVKIRLFYLLVGFFFLFNLNTMFRVQITKHREYSDSVKDRYTIRLTHVGKRGEVLDCNGHIFAGNIPVINITATPSNFRFIDFKAEDPSESPEYNKRNRDLRERDAKIRKIVFKVIKDECLDKLELTEDKKKHLLEIMASPMRSDGKRKRKWMMIKTDVPYSEAMKIKANLISAFKKAKKIYSDSKVANHIPGAYNLGAFISFEEKYKRSYPKGRLLANIIGYTQKGELLEKGKVGVEKWFDDILTPQVEVENRFLLNPNYKKYNLDGSDIYLTIDESVQSIVEAELDKLVKKHHPKRAYAIMVDPKTGDIIAAAERPTFNINDTTTRLPESVRLKMSLDAYEPGSVMKPIIISKAIDVGILNANTTINCENGRWAFGGSVLTDHEPYGVLTVAEVIKFSSNIGTAKIGVKLGDKNVYNILKLFGLTSKTGFPDTRKTGSSLQNYKKWSKMKVTRVVIGQGVSVTPLQLVRAYCALANKGILPELRLLDRIKHGEEIVKIKPSVKRIVLKHPESAEKITNIMKLVTQEGGTATKAAVDGYYLAGKTGTAQKAINGRYSNSKFCATFVGFIPADNPKFVLLVMADEPHNGHYGGSVAGPTFKAIADETLRYYSIRPDYYIEDEVK